MRFLHVAWIMGAMILCGCGEVPKAPESDRKEYEQLAGTWHVVEMEAGGNPVPRSRVKEINLRYVFNRDKVGVYRSDGNNKTSTFAIDASTNPKRLTINQSPVIRAVYELNRNKLRICVMVDDKPDAGYPTQLASKALPHTDLLVLERQQ